MKMRRTEVLANTAFSQQFFCKSMSSWLITAKMAIELQKGKSRI
jgi:hypothetical protein